jgi:hypothetical protein
MSYHDFDASYVLMTNKFGKIIALHVRPHHKRSKTCVWVPKCEGPEKATRGGGGVNGRQSKFLAGTWPISRNRPDIPLF